MRAKSTLGMGRRACRVAAFAAGLVLLAARTSDASPLFELAGATTGNGGFNARATGASAASTYFNPALLPKAGQSFEVGVLVLSDQISLTLDGRTGGIVPDIVGGRALFDPNAKDAPISNATLPTRWLEKGCPESECGSPPIGARPRQGAGSSGKTHTYGVVGLVNRLIKDRLVLGFYALIPIGDFTTAHSFYNDEREQFFSNSLHPEMYSDRMTATSLAFGLGSKIFEGLSVGASFTLNLTNKAEASTYVRDPIDYDKLFISTDVRVHTSVSPHFGIAYDPLDWLHLSGTAHSEQRFTIDTGVAAVLPAGQESGTHRTSVHSILPWTFGLGAAVDLNRGDRHEISVVGSARYALWSNYLDRHGERPDADGRGLGFHNTLAGSLGVRHQTGAVRNYLDLSYQPTPVPKQVGKMNYVDNDRVGAVLGSDYRFELLDLVFRVGAQVQAQHLLYRHQTKDDSLLRDELPDDAVDASRQPVAGAGGLQTNNPGWPGFASEGWILGGALTASLLY